MTAILFLWWPSWHDKLRWHPRANIAVDIVTMSTGASKKSRGSCLLLLT